VEKRLWVENVDALGTKLIDAANVAYEDDTDDDAQDALVAIFADCTVPVSTLAVPA
jgi:hypothetical protein